ncbi:MAG: hypothetical protein A2074_05220 [Candidatus Aquicultor primus]|uniref:DUF3887 domain-containing protein n=1 Tax=Candidatus Aquicultor primus TaxID=1797195 RepID=A0A1F2UGY4_9ACTN|nr:MAG: hypothetical protein A2074_05220 [Candidatus Aquicultor primus]HCG99905.1 hypothetical protein [Actinomycetota bacterium]
MMRSKRVCLVISLLLAAILLLSCSNRDAGVTTKEQNAAVPKELISKAHALVDVLAAEDYALAVKDFDDAMEKALPADKLGAVWKSTVEQAGPFQQRLGERTEQSQGYDIVNVECEFEKSDIDVRVVYDRDGKIAGLFFKPGRATAQERKARRELNMPVLLVYETGIKATELHALLAYWEVKSGRITIDKKRLSQDAVNADARFHKPGSTPSSKVGKYKPPLPASATLPETLLLEGTTGNLILLEGYDDTSLKGATGKLVVGIDKDSKMSWRRVDGACYSIMAAYSPDAIKVGDNIYIDDKSGGLTVKTIDLTREPLKLRDYEPANSLIADTKDVFDAQETSPLGFGKHKDVLLVIVGGNTKTWVWAVQNDTLIGTLAFDPGERRLVSLKDNIVLDQERFDETPNHIRLPRR